MFKKISGYLGSQCMGFRYPCIPKCVYLQKIVFHFNIVSFIVFSEEDQNSWPKVHSLSIFLALIQRVSLSLRCFSDFHTFYVLEWIRTTNVKEI